MGVALKKHIPNTKENFEIRTDVIENDAIILKFDHFLEKHSTLKGCISVVL